MFAPDGRRLTGDIAFRPDIVKPDGGGVWFRPKLTSREGRRPTYMRTKAKQLSDGNVLVIARDVDEMTRLRNYMLAGIAWSGVVALIGGLGYGALCSTVQLGVVAEIGALPGRLTFTCNARVDQDVNFASNCVDSRFFPREDAQGRTQG